MQWASSTYYLKLRKWRLTVSKLNLTEVEDKDMVPNVISALVDAFHTQTQRLPDALIITTVQAKAHFIANGEPMANFRGIPLEPEKRADETSTVIKTVNGILAGMHATRSAEVRDVYQMLENMKIKLEDKKNG
jgi:hypothetical protein